MDNTKLKRLLTSASKEKKRTIEPTVQAATSNSRSSSISGASSSKRKRTSSEPEQNREIDKDPLNKLARMLMTNRVSTANVTRPMQGYVKREKYDSLKDKYNNLVDDYEALQRKFRQTLDCLGSLGDSGVESDVNEEHNDAVPIDIEDVPEGDKVQEINNEEILENAEGKLSDNHDEEDVIVNTNAYVSDAQWSILLRSQSVKLFVENTLQILFGTKTLLKSTVPSNDGNSSSADNVLDKIRIEVLRGLLDRYLEERRPEISVVEKETGRREWLNYTSLYIARLKQKQNEALMDITIRKC